MDTTLLADRSVAESPDGDGASATLHESCSKSKIAELQNGFIDSTHSEEDKSDSSTQYQEAIDTADEGDKTLHAEQLGKETASEGNEDEVTTPTPQDDSPPVFSEDALTTPTPKNDTPIFNPQSSPSSYSPPISFKFDSDRPRDHCVRIVVPNTRECPVYALVLCSWDNILGPNAQYVWETEQKVGFTKELLNYLSTHTLTSSDQPENTVDTKMLILKERGILVTSFLFSGYDGVEKTVFSLSLVVPYSECPWYLPLHEFCVSRLSMMIGKLRVLQDKYKEEVSWDEVESGFKFEGCLLLITFYIHICGTCQCVFVLGQTFLPWVMMGEFPLSSSKFVLVPPPLPPSPTATPTE